MKKYYILKEADRNGDHIVHDEFCRDLKGIEKRYFLGEYPSCSEAVDAGRIHYYQVIGCILCSPACHPLYFS